MQDISYHTRLYNLTPNDILALERTHPDISLWRTSLSPDIIPDKEEGEISASGQSTSGQIRLCVMRIRGPQGITPLIKKLQRLPSKAHNNLILIRGLYAVAQEPLALFSFNYPSITIMEYLEIHSTHDRRASCADIARGLDYLHRREIVHGAVRPSNVLVRPDGTCVLGEFSDEDIPSADAFERFGAYLAPELENASAYFTFALDNYRKDEYLGEYRLESDIYALGCTAVEIYTGAPPPALRIPYDRVKTRKELFHLVRIPSARERAVIPPGIRAALSDIMHIMPDHRPHSGNALQWLDRPDLLRVKACAPVLARNQLRRAARSFWNSS